MILDLFVLAFKNLKNKKLRTWLTMLGIFIGVSMVVALVSLGQGMQNAIDAQFSSIGVDKIIIQPTSPGFGPPGQDSAGNLSEKDLKTIKQTQGVKVAAGRIIQSVKIEFNDIAKAQFAASMPKDSSARELIKVAQNMKIQDGRMLKPKDSGKVILGNNFASKEIFDKNIRIGNKILIGNEKFEVIGILKKNGNPMRDDIIILNEDDLKEISGRNDYSTIFVQVQEGSDVNNVAEKLTRALRRRKNQKEGFEDFEVQTSQELIDSFNTILNIVQIFVLGIAAISIIVGGIGIMNTMYTSVLEKTKEIGVMKAIGAKNKDIMLLFLIESGILGAVGGAIGLAMGICFSLAVEFGAKAALGTNIISAHFPLALIAGTILFSFIIGAISGTLPAMQASRLEPVEALRK